MKKEFITAEIEFILFLTDIISTSDEDEGGFWLPTDEPRSVSVTLDP